MRQSEITVAAAETYAWNNRFLYKSELCRVAPNGCEEADECSRMYISFRIPDDIKQSRIRQAVLTLVQTEGENGGASKIGVYAVPEELTAGACSPASDAYPSDYSRAQRSISPVSHLFDITSLLRKTNSRLCLEVRMVDETEADGSYACFCGVGEPSLAPKLILTVSEEDESAATRSEAETSGTENLLRGHGMESFADLNEWETCFNCDDFEVSVRAAGALFGKAAVLLRSYDDAAAGSGLYQTVYLQKPGKYCFSAYVKALGEDIQSGIHSIEAGIYLRIAAADGAQIQSRKVTRSKQYERIFIEFTVQACKTVRAEILMDGRGCALVDGVQLEYGEMTAYNLVCNAGFSQGRQGTEHWQTSAWGVYPCKGEVGHVRPGGSVQLLTDADSMTYVRQSIPLQGGDAERQRYVFSAVARAPGAVPDTFHKYLHTPVFRLRARVWYGTGRFYDYTADFGSAQEAYTSAQTEFEANLAAGATQIDLFCEYGGNFGVAYFDRICLVRTDINPKAVGKKGQGQP